MLENAGPGEADTLAEFDRDGCHAQDGQAFKLPGTQWQGALGAVEVEAGGVLRRHPDATEHGAGVAVQHAQPEFFWAVVAEEIIGAVFAGEALGDAAGLPGGGLVAGALEGLDVGEGLGQLPRR